MLDLSWSLASSYIFSFLQSNNTLSDYSVVSLRARRAEAVGTAGDIRECIWLVVVVVDDDVKPFHLGESLIFGIRISGVGRADERSVGEYLSLSSVAHSWLWGRFHKIQPSWLASFVKSAMAGWYWVGLCIRQKRRGLIRHGGGPMNSGRAVVADELLEALHGWMRF